MIFLFLFSLVVIVVVSLDSPLKREWIIVGPEQLITRCERWSWPSVMPQYKFMVVATWTGHIHPLTTLSVRHTDRDTDRDTDTHITSSIYRHKDTDIQNCKLKREHFGANEK